MYSMITIGPRPRSGIYLESTNAEALGVRPGEDRLVKDVMSREVTTVDASASVKDATQTMRNRDLPILIVYRGNEPILALTEYDMVIDGAVHDHRSGSATLYEITKNREPIRCREDAILADAIHAMLNHHARHVPVIDAEGTLVGVLSLVDAVGAVTPEAAAVWLTKMRQSTAQAHESV
jgi:CBS domain-containing protein